MPYVDEKKVCYLVLAYPKLNMIDKKWINDLREKFDKLYYHVVNEHFTLVFATLYPNEIDFINEIKEQSKLLEKFSFSIRSSIMNNDKLSEYFYAFLVPDQGFSNIVKIHQKLYSGKINHTLLIDVDFVPHIGVGSFTDKFECKKLVNEINNSNIEINGKIDELDIIKYVNNKVETIDKIILK
jgi:2'-5' RNA ligase superfamily